MKRHIALTGFMASGKSTVGKKLARKLRTAFFDADDIIVAQHGEIAAIFAKEGEKRFREYEYAAIADVLENGEPGVIALGGGAVTNDKTLTLLKKRSYRVFIKASPEQILGRLRKSKQIRPLLGAAPTLADVNHLYTRRMPLYAHSDLVVEADGLTTTQVVDRIVQWMHHKHIEL